MTSSTRESPVADPRSTGRRWQVRALLAWSVVLWISRLRNVLSNDELDATGTALRVGVVVVFVGLAVGAFVALRRGELRVLWVLILWTVGYWIIRGGGILIDDYSVGFKAIHTVLTVVSLVLAVLAARQLRGDSSAERIR